MGATVLPCATKTAVLTVGNNSSQESVEGTLDDLGSRAYTDMLNSKTWNVTCSAKSSWVGRGPRDLSDMSLGSQGQKLC